MIYVVLLLIYWIVAVWVVWWVAVKTGLPQGRVEVATYVIAAPLLALMAAWEYAVILWRRL